MSKPDPQPGPVLGFVWRFLLLVFGAALVYFGLHWLFGMGLGL